VRIAQTFTACDSFQAHKSSGKADAQHAMILAHIKTHGGDWSIGEIAHALGMEKSTVSPRIRELLDTDELEAKPNRKDRRSGIRIRPVGLPVVGQGMLF
jgi:DNA-binding MarR family transcriptional regulator